MAQSKVYSGGAWVTGVWKVWHNGQWVIPVPKVYHNGQWVIVGALKYQVTVGHSVENTFHGWNDSYVGSISPGSPRVGGYPVTHMGTNWNVPCDFTVALSGLGSFNPAPFTSVRVKDRNGNFRTFHAADATRSASNFRWGSGGATDVWDHLTSGPHEVEFIL